MVAVGRLADRADAPALQHILDILKRCHGRAARCGHYQRTMRHTRVDGCLQVFTGQQTIDNTGRKSVSGTHTIIYIEVLEAQSFEKFTRAPQQSAPIVNVGRLDEPHTRSDDFQMRKILGRSRYGFGETIDL